jgi:hypothetical protein
VCGCSQTSAAPIAIALLVLLRRRYEPGVGDGTGIAATTTVDE